MTCSNEVGGQSKQKRGSLCASALCWRCILSHQLPTAVQQRRSVSACWKSFWGSRMRAGVRCHLCGVVARSCSIFMWSAFGPQKCCQDTHLACKKYLRGRRKPQSSTNRNIGGKPRKHNGFIMARHKKMIRIQTTTLATPLATPSGVLSATSRALMLSRKSRLPELWCQTPIVMPMTTPVKATLSSKQGQLSAGSG